MADFEITSPDGKKFVVTAPDGATQDQVLSYAKSQFKPQAAAQAAPPPPPEQPGIGGKMFRGALTGGPMGAIIAGAGHGLDAMNEAVAKGAYDAGGKVTEVASGMGASPETAAKFGLATNVGIQAVPAFLGGKGTGQVIAPSMESAAENLMQSALKPTLKTLQTGKAATAIDTLLENGINVTAGGLQKLRDHIGELNREIALQVRNSPATVDKQSVFNALKDTLDRFTRQVNPQNDISAIRGAWDNFVNHPLLAGKTDIPVQLAQDLKQGTYQALSKKYGELGGAETEAQKAIARGLKEGISKAVPGIEALNAEESKLLTTLNVAERRVLMDANKNPGGLLWLAHNPQATLSFAADRSPLFKSLLARMLYSGSERIPEAAGAAAILTGEQIQKNRN